MLRKIDMIITVIKNTIESNPYLKIKFNHPNRKYNVDELLPYIIQVLEHGVSYRNIKTKTNICWNALRIKIEDFYSQSCKLKNQRFFNEHYI